MALTQGARNKIKSIVQAAKKLLMKEFESQLQQYYGIRPDGSCLLVEELTSREASVIETARLLRQRLHYLEEGIAGNDKAPEAVRQLVREQAFTILNRFAAVRMSEERNIIRESIRKGYNSEGFLVYDQLTGGAKTAEQFTRYNWYIGHVFDELAIDLPAVFDRFSPYALLFPSEKVLLELLEIINDEDLNIYRESGHQPINLWTEDETIGWIYQYYNSREEISEMREASGAPRNSRELAVRNQFFTPRYVVQFLVDNSLGRQWFEMTKGQTSLVDSCQYMVKREQEIFLEKGEEIPEAKIEGANYIEYRALKDPREILMLDPACGSMHFGLYCFDLFEQIYLEAWDNHPELMTDLRDKYMRDDFIKRIPGYILRYNIHGVDIDPRAIQIAGLSLWLRAQKSYDKLGLQPADRPAISKSNLVIAEPMPGDAHLLSEFTKSLPGPIGKLVRVIWDKMQLAGETGLLLKIEEELKKEIEIAKEEYKEYKNTSAQSTLFASPAESKAAEMAAIYGKGQKITKDFFDTAEEEVLKALKGFAENAEGEDAFQKLLFAEDTARGFAFIELCRKRYDVIVMNPPFGAGSISTEAYYKDNYTDWGKNILCCFFSRMNHMCNLMGNVGAIFDRTVLIKSSYEDFRKNQLIGNIKSVADTGWGVLDANVETTVFNLEHNSKIGSFIDLRKSDNKRMDLINVINSNHFIERNSEQFNNLPNSIIGYDYTDFEINFFSKNRNIKSISHGARQGHALNSFKHFRLWWEPKTKKYWKNAYKSIEFSSFYCECREVVWYPGNGDFIRHDKSLRSSNASLQLKQGLGYGKRGEYWDTHVLRPETIFTHEGQAIPDLSNDEIYHLVLFTNSVLSQYIINLFCGQHKGNGYVNLLPVPEYEGDLNQNLDTLISIKQFWLSYDETSQEFSYQLISDLMRLNSISELVDNIQKRLKDDNKTLYNFIAENDEFWLSKVNAPEDYVIKLKEYANQRPKENVSSLFNVSSDKLKERIIFELFQNLFGVLFKRIDLTSEQMVSQISNPLPLCPSSINSVNVSLYYTSDNSDRSIINHLKRLVVKTFKDQITLDEFADELGINSLSEFLNSPNVFFNYHYNRYNHCRRESPIYWPIATKSNKYIVWLYYPALNDNSLFSVVNELVDPKIKEITKEVEVLEMKGSAKELNNQKEFLAELEDFKEELLRVAQLPYKPNQDDGVLITAAPLHNLFRHTKWKKATQDCWKKLEKGEYDWAHLAYSIWPDRVRKKCVKDLSMAIAHGLEEICEVKPKVRVEKKTKEIKADAQLNIK
jgi:hypothetical protein